MVFSESAELKAFLQQRDKLIKNLPLAELHATISTEMLPRNVNFQVLNPFCPFQPLGLDKTKILMDPSEILFANL